MTRRIGWAFARRENRAAPGGLVGSCFHFGTRAFPEGRRNEKDGEGTVVVAVDVVQAVEVVDCLPVFAADQRLEVEDFGGVFVVD